MKFTLMIYGFLLKVSSSQCEETIFRGTEGEQVIIGCNYAQGYENSYKYFYKGPYKDRNLILQSAGGGSSESGRFSLWDDHRTRSLTLTIRNLTMADTGLYGCVAGWGEYKLIQLNVVKAPQKTRPVKISTSTLHPYTNTSTDHTSTVTPRTERETTRTMTGSTADQLNQTNTNLSSVAGGLGSVLLVLVLCSGTFLILKKRKRKSETALFQQNVQHNTETSSDQTPASHLNTRPQISDVYATVTKQQPDSNPSHTLSTNQVTDTDCDYDNANMKPPETTTDRRTEIIYSTVACPQNIKTNNEPIYSVIQHK